MNRPSTIALFIAAGAAVTYLFDRQVRRVASEVVDERERRQSKMAAKAIADIIGSSATQRARTNG